jgi:phosphomannomutase/phosphoglucomutase
VKVKESIFRNYDIRGIYPDELDEKLSYHIGQAFGTLIKRRHGSKVVVGRDNRESSFFITEDFIKGAMSTGCDVTYVGVTATPVIHFLTCGREFDAGVEVTASHNPSEFNGFRMDYQGAESVYGKDIQKLLKMIKEQDYVTGKGEYHEKDLTHKYFEYLEERFVAQRPLKIVFDCGNGTASELAPRLFEHLGYEVIPMYCDFDSEFPHGVPDPENPIFLGELAQRVKESGADVGFGFDTDADRFGLVDEKGNIYTTDELLMFFAEALLKKNPHERVLYDVKSSGAIDGFVKERNGIATMIRTGHPYFTEEMKKGAVVGAEYSGHIYFGDDYFGFDDGIYAGCRVAQILGDSNKKMSELMSVVPRQVGIHEVKVHYDDDRKFALVEDMAALIKKDDSVVGFSEVDGIRANISPTGWFLVRASNTTPNISIRLAGATEREKTVLIRKVDDLFTKFDLKVPWKL